VLNQELEKIFKSVSGLIQIEDLLKSKWQNQKVVISFSGGKDSFLVALLYYYWSQRFELPKPTLFYLDHCWRDTKEDHVIIQNQSKILGFPLVIDTLDESTLELFSTTNKEEQGREARYLKLKTLFGYYNYAVTGHHVLDYTESLIMHWTRGGGKKSTETLPIFSLIPIKRFLPLVFFKDQELYLCHQIIRDVYPVATDPSNEEERFKRNRIRKNIIPLLNKEGLSSFHLYWNFHSYQILDWNDFDSVEHLSSADHPSLHGMDWLRIPRLTWELASHDKRYSLLLLHLNLLQISSLPKTVFVEFLTQMNKNTEVSQIQTNQVKILCQKTGDIWILKNDSDFYLPPKLISRSETSIEIKWNSQAWNWQIQTNEVLRTALPGDKLYRNGNPKDLWDCLREKGIPSELRKFIPVLATENRVTKMATAALGL